MEARTTITLWSTGIKHLMSIEFNGRQLNRHQLPRIRSDGSMVPTYGRR